MDEHLEAGGGARARGEGEGAYVVWFGRRLIFDHQDTVCKPTAVMISRLRTYARHLFSPKSRVLQEQVDVLKVLLLVSPAHDKLPFRRQAEMVQLHVSDAAERLLSEPRAQTRVDSSKQCEGQGVFAASFIPRGQLVCLYPGLVSTPSQFARRQVLNPQSTMHCTALPDGSVIDPSCLAPAGQSGIASAVGHMVNHPPQGQLPSVIKCAFFWPGPTQVNATDVTDDGTGGPSADLVDVRGELVRGLGLVAVRNIDEGEEVFVNYRLNPKLRAQWPAWYHAVDEHEDAARWME
jgi:hypothetical protein